MGFLGIVGGDFWRICGDALDGFSYSFGSCLGGFLGGLLDGSFFVGFYLSNIVILLGGPPHTQGFWP